MIQDNNEQILIQNIQNIRAIIINLLWLKNKQSCQTNVSKSNLRLIYFNINTDVVSHKSL